MGTQNGASAGATNGELKETLVVGQNSQGVEIRATLLRLTRYLAVFEIYNPALVLRTSEVLNEFKIVFRDRAIYSGRAVIRSLVDTGLLIVCEVSLNDGSWMDFQLTSEVSGKGKLQSEFGAFLQEWQKLYKVVPDFKVVMADMQSFLSDLRLWLEQVELEIRSSPSADRIQLERDVVNELSGPVARSIDVFIERFESMVPALEPELHPVHRNYLRRQLHPYLLSSPFAYRAYHKPLGYAGDYEVVDMMLRAPYEGSSLFAKIINVWLLEQAPALAHRNRVSYLTRRLVEETTRAQRQGKVARVYNLGCGPAGEVQNFLREYNVAGKTELTLLDFNEETLQHLRGTLDSIRQQYHTTTPVQLIKKSVAQLLKEGGRSITRPSQDQYDFVYCAGLFDYLPDPACKRLMNLFYDMLAPGGLLLATNVSDVMNSVRPFRYSMEYILDWHLIYRDGKGFAKLSPDRAPQEGVNVISEDIGVNVFIEVRKPGNG